MADATFDAGVRQLAGPGVKEMEADVPLWHFDVQVKDASEFLADPVAFARRLGLGSDQGIKQDQPMNITIAGDLKSAAVMCCYTSGGHTVCHTH